MTWLNAKPAGRHLTSPRLPSGEIQPLPPTIWAINLLKIAERVPSDGVPSSGRLAPSAVQSRVRQISQRLIVGWTDFSPVSFLLFLNFFFLKCQINNKYWWWKVTLICSISMMLKYSKSLNLVASTMPGPEGHEELENDIYDRHSPFANCFTNIFWSYFLTQQVINVKIFRWLKHRKPGIVRLKLTFTSTFQFIKL